MDLDGEEDVPELIAEPSEDTGLKISQRFFLPSDQERKKILESTQIKNQMNSISMVNDFATYAKLQRKLNHITLNLEADALSRKSLRNDFARIIKLSLYTIAGATYLVTLFWFGTKSPVLVLPSDWFFPLSFILSYPTGVPGAVSLPVWTLLTRTLISCF